MRMSDPPYKFPSPPPIYPIGRGTCLIYFYFWEKNNEEHFLFSVHAALRLHSTISNCGHP